MLEWMEVVVVLEYMNVMCYNFDSYGFGNFIFMLFVIKLLIFDVVVGMWSFVFYCDCICENF